MNKEETTRQKKYNRLLQREIGDIFQKNASRMFDGAFITVTQVKVTPDLAQANVYLSFLLATDKAAMLERVQELAKPLRQQLGNRIGQQVRIIPELFYFLDDTQEQAAKIDQLFEDLKIPPADENSDMSDYNL
jgi:ribosome-binding factor A